MLGSFFLIGNRLRLFKFERFDINAELCCKLCSLLCAYLALWLCSCFLRCRLFNWLFLLDRFCVGIHFDQLAHNWRFYC